MEKNLNINLSLTIPQVQLLMKIDEEEGYEPENNDHEEDLHILCEKGVVESVLGEQFYITRLGKEFLNS